MENRRPKYLEDEGYLDSSPKSFKLFGYVIEMHVDKKKGGSCSSSNELGVNRGFFLGPKTIDKE